MRHRGLAPRCVEARSAALSTLVFFFPVPPSAPSSQVKHEKPRKEGETGQILRREASVHHSNVMLFSKEKQVASRVGHKVLDDGKKVRVLLKTGEVLPS